MKKYLRHLPAVLGVALLCGAIYVVQREFRHIKLDDITASLRLISAQKLVIAFLWTVAAYGVLTFYDRLGTIYAGHKVSYLKSAFASFCAYTLSHNLGFAAVSGAAVRYRLYAHWGLATVEIAKVVAFCSLTFGLGAMVLGGAILVLEPRAVPFFGGHLPIYAMYGIGALLWGIVAAYITLASVVGTVKMFGHSFELPGWRMAILQVLLATLDVAVTAAICFALLPDAPGLTFLRFLAIYLTSYTAGLAANIPGGIGVFDSAMLLGLEPYLTAPQVVGAIVVFRLFYYVIPLFLAGSMFAGNEILVRGAELRSGKLAGLARSMSGRNQPDFAIAAATGLVAMSGALLLSLAVLQPPADFSWIDPDFVDVADSAGQFIPSLIGAGLMVLAIGMAQRVTLAWGATIVMLLVAAVFSVAQAQSMWITVALVLSAVLVSPFRSAFYRRARLLSGPLQAATAVPLLVFVVCILTLAGFERHVRHMIENSWWEIVLSRDVPNSLRAAVALTVVLALLALWRLIRPGRVQFSGWNREAQLRYASFGAMPPAEADGVVWGEAERSGVPFRRLNGILLGLGDPAGADADRASAIWRLRDLAQQEGRHAAVWRAGSEHLKIYEDLGLTALPLGPDGRPLPAAADESDPHAQYLCCMVDRDLGRLLPMLGSLPGEQATPPADLGRVVAMPVKKSRPGDAAA